MSLCEKCGNQDICKYADNMKKYDEKKELPFLDCPIMRYRLTCEKFVPSLARFECHIDDISSAKPTLMDKIKKKLGILSPSKCFLSMEEDEDDR